MHAGAQQRPDLDAEDVGLGEAEPDAAHAEEWIALVNGEARHGLVAARIGGADRHRLGPRPFQHLAIGAVLHLLVRQAVAVEEFGAHQSDAVDMADVDMLGLDGVGDVDMDGDCHAIGGHCRPGCEARRNGRRCVEIIPRGLPCRDRGFARKHHQTAGSGIEQRLGVGVDMARSDANNHRHAALPCQHGDMAGRAALPKHDSTTGPVVDQEGAGRDIVGEIQRACRNGHLAVAAQRAQHPIPDICQVGSACTKILLFGLAVALDLRVEHLAPRNVCGHAGLDRRPCRFGKRVVSEHRDLELDNVGRIAARLVHQRGCRGDGLLDRGDEMGVFRIGGPVPDISAARILGRAEHRSARKAGTGRQARKAHLCPGLLRLSHDLHLRRNSVRPAPAAWPPPHRHPRRSRGYATRYPRAPSWPSP